MASFAPEASTSHLPMATREQVQEHAHKLTQRMHALKAEGHTEETSQELAGIMNSLKILVQQFRASGLANGAPTANGIVENGGDHANAPFHAFSPGQNAVLRCQVHAFKMLSRGQPLAPQLLEAIGDPDAALRFVEMSEAAHVVEANRAEQEDLADIEETETPETSAIYPYNMFRTPLQTLKEAGYQPGRPSYMPTLLPKGIDPYALRDERNRIIEAQIAHRIRELEELPALISDHSVVEGRASQKVRALIELKSLRLLAKQKALREEVVRGMTQATALTLTADRPSFRRVRKPTLHDARQVEAMEKQQKQERDRRLRQKHLDRLQAVATHGEDLRNAHIAHVSVVQRLGKLVQRFHIDTEREESKRMERVSKERLKALKADDEEAYLKLIDKTKDTRITHLLGETDKYLDGLAKAVVTQQNRASGIKSSAAAESKQVDEKDFGANPISVGGKVEETRLDYYNVAHAIKETVDKQPAMLQEGHLKEYQLKGLQWMVSLYNNRLNGILADEMGLGKTIQSIALICYLVETKRVNGPFIIIVPLSTMTNWEVEFSRWAPTLSVIPYKGSPAQRKNLGNRMSRAFNVCLTTYEYIIKDRPILAKQRWEHMIIDEGQRMKNTQSKLSQTIAQYYHSKYRLILTGTPLQNNLPELWALLNFVLPSVFNSVKSFDEWFNTPFASTGGSEKMELNEEEALLVIRRLHKVLRPFLLRRLKKDVEADLPDKVERIIKCKMSALQIRLYRQVKDFNVLLAEDGLKKGGTLQGLNNQLMQLRKICNHPFVFRPVEETLKQHMGGYVEHHLSRVSGKLELLDRILPKLFATGHRVLMFFQMTHVMDIVQDWLAQKGIRNLRLDGAVSQEIRGDLLKTFNAPGSEYNIFLLSTRAGGLGLNLQTADTVIIYDSDWNPHQDLQAQDRAHRIGQKKEVRIFRLVTSNSVEETILSRSRTKLDMDKKIIQGGRFDNKSSEKERDAFLRAILEAQVEAGEEDEDMGDEELNSILARSEEEEEIFQRMDMEREARELHDWRQRGGEGSPPDRLMGDAELPMIYRKDPVIKRQLRDEDDMFDASGRRKRKNRTDVIYDDGLTEDQFARLVDDDNVDISEGLAAAKMRNRAGQETPGDYDSFIDDSDDPLAVGRKRSHASMNPSAAVSIDGGERVAKRQRGNPAAPKDPWKQLYKNIVREVESLENPEGYPTSSLFLEIPSKDDYPDYHVFIKQPLAIKQIKSRIDNNRYRNGPEQFISDWGLMLQNATTYNEPSSNVVRDAQQMYDHVKAAIDAATSAPPPSQPDSMNGASTAGNTTQANATPVTQSEANTPAPEIEQPIRIKLGRRVIEESSGSESE